MNFFAYKLNKRHYLKCLEPSIKSTTLKNLHLLLLGKILREQITKHWLQPKEIQQKEFLEDTCCENHVISDDSRQSFIKSKQFFQNLNILKTQKCKIIKMQVNRRNVNSSESIQFVSQSKTIMLITDYFVQESYALAKLYSLQRQRKMWWMRLSAEPGRYSLKPFEIINSLPKAKSVNIQSQHCFGTIVLEHLTLVYLGETQIENNELTFTGECKNKNKATAVIRSVIDLDLATCALLFDATENKSKNRMLLNRKLTPYQCLVVYTPRVSSAALVDLNKHISHEITRAGLRVLNLNKVLKEEYEHQNYLELGDKVGIPYIILINDRSLADGLILLRNRDTGLEETIHISNIVQYLLNLFNLK